MCVIAPSGAKLGKVVSGLTPLAFLGKINEWLSDHVTKVEPVIVDRSLRYTAGRYLYFDCSKAIEELGYEPTPIRDAIEDAVTWFLSRRS